MRIRGLCDYPIIKFYYEFEVDSYLAVHFGIQGGEIKSDLEIGKTAKQPEPAQIADLSISVSRLISSRCMNCH